MQNDENSLSINEEQRQSVVGRLISHFPNIIQSLKAINLKLIVSESVTSKRC